MKNRWPISTALVFISTFPALAYPAADEKACQFEKLSVEKEMTRAQVEQMVAALRGGLSSYEPRSGGLQGGSVEYCFRGCTMTIEYRPGMLPPYVIGPGGVWQHLAPIDEAVEAVVIKRAGSQPKE